MEKKKRVVSEETKAKMRKAALGRKMSQETKDRISKAKKGTTAWNKGIPNPNATKNLGKFAKKGGVSGKDGANWKGGLIKSGDYYYVYDEELGRHFGGKYVKRADFNWFKKHGELIREPYFLHHIDHNKENDSIDNLAKVHRGEHSTITNMSQLRDVDGRFLKKE